MCSGMLRMPSGRPPSFIMRAAERGAGLAAGRGANADAEAARVAATKTAARVMLFFEVEKI